MILQHSYATLDDAPEAYRALYKPASDGRVYITVEGMTPSARVDEFRTNNTRLQKEVKEYRAFIGLTGDDTLADSTVAAHVRELFEKDAAGEIQIGKKKTKEEMDKEVENRVAAHKLESEKTIKKLTEENGTLKTGLEKVMIDNAVATEATAKGVLPTALGDLILKCRQTFKIVDGKPVPYNGNDIIYSTDGVTPKTVAEYMESLVTTAPHFFSPNKGSDAQASKDKGGYTGVNPFMKGTAGHNMTEQGRLLRANPVLANRLRAEALSAEQKKP